MLPVQCKMARTALGIGVRELAAAAKVSTDTVARFERGDPLKERTVDALRAALEAAGIQFIPENGGGAGVRLAKPSAATQATENAEARDSTARHMAAHQVNKALKNVAASPGEKAARRDRLTKPPKRPAEPIDEGKRPDELDASNDD